MYVCMCFEMFEIILDWQKSCKKSPDVNFLHNHQTFIKTMELTLLKHYQLAYRIYSDFTSFSHQCPFAVPNSNQGSPVVLSYHIFLVSANLWQFLNLLFSFYDLDTFEEYRSVIL